MIDQRKDLFLSGNRFGVDGNGVALLIRFESRIHRELMLQHTEIRFRDVVPFALAPTNSLSKHIGIGMKKRI